jgi:hypothetical protein
MSVRDRAVLSAASAGSAPAYDASPLVVRKSLKAWTTPVDGALLI